MRGMIYFYFRGFYFVFLGRELSIGLRFEFNINCFIKYEEKFRSFLKCSFNLSIRWRVLFIFFKIFLGKGTL